MADQLPALSRLERNTVLLALRVLELAKTQRLYVEGEHSPVCDVLNLPQFADYEPTLAAHRIPLLCDKINDVAVSGDSIL